MIDCGTRSSFSLKNHRIIKKNLIKNPCVNKSAFQQIKKKKNRKGMKTYFSLNVRCVLRILGIFGMFRYLAINQLVICCCCWKTPQN